MDDGPLFVDGDVNLDHDVPRALFHWRVSLILATVVCVAVSWLAEQSTVIYAASSWSAALGATGVVMLAMAIRWVSWLGRLAATVLFGLLGVRWLLLLTSAVFNDEIRNPRGPLTSSFVYLFAAYYYAIAMLGTILPTVARDVELPRRRAGNQ